MPDLILRAAVWALLMSSSPLGAELVFLEDFERREQVLFAKEGTSLEEFGRAVGISGNVIVAGAPQDAGLGSRAGAAYVFEQGADNIWRESAKLTASDGAPGEFFGRTVAISGSRIAVGAASLLRSGNQGKVYVFERNLSGSWEEVVILSADDKGQDGSFGATVDIDGDILAVGDFGFGEQSGQISVFERSSTGTWQATDTFGASDGQPGEGFGLSLAVSGHSIIVGAGTFFDAAEKAYVFDRQSNGMWTESDILRSPDGKAGDLFGLDVDIHDDTAAVGATGDDDNGNASGSVYLFQRASEFEWIFTTELHPASGGELREFGFRVELSDKRLLVAAEQDTFVNGFAGAVHVFDRQDDGGWQETDKRVPFAPESGDAFGSALALDRSRAVVGASGDEAAGAESNSGAAYFFN